MKVLRLIESFYPFVTGPASQAFRISKELEKNRILSPIFTSASREKDKWVNVKRFEPKFSIFGLAYTPQMKKAIINEQPDIIHAHNIRTYQTELAARCAKQLDIPLVVSSHGAFMADKDFAKKAFDLFGKAAKDASAIIVSSETEYSVAIDYVDADKLHVIPDGLDMDDFRVKRDKKGKRILFKGDVAEIQGHVEGMELRIIDDQVSADQELIKEFRNADVFISANNDFSLIQAGAAGLPVIAKDTLFAREIIDNGRTGYIVEDFSDLKDYIKKANKKMGERLQEKVREKFDWEEVMMAYERLYAKVKGI